jgi:hypothetical protein
MPPDPFEGPRNVALDGGLIFRLQIFVARAERFRDLPLHIDVRHDLHAGSGRCSAG